MFKLLLTLLVILFISNKSHANISKQYSYKYSTPCADGTYSSSNGSGSCSHHGGRR